MGPLGSPLGPLGPLGAQIWPNPPRLGVSIFKNFTKIGILGIFGVQNCGFGVQNGGSKLGFDQGALPSANISPEIRLFGISKLGFDQGALPSANISPEIRLLGLTQCPCVEITQSLRAGGAAGGRANSDPTGVHPPTQDCYPPAGGDQCNMPSRAPPSRPRRAIGNSPVNRAPWAPWGPMGPLGPLGPPGP